MIKICDDDNIPIVPFTGQHASYGVVGGLGEMGRSIVRWMADRKAKNFLLLGHSGARGEVALMNELRKEVLTSWPTVRYLSKRRTEDCVGDLL